VTLATAIDGSQPLRLADIDPAADGGLDEADAARRLRDLAAELLELQHLLQAAETHGVLVVLQGMDAAGKDVTIQHALGGANPEAIRVTHFSSMTEEEELHDFLWRAHAATPKRGEMVVFDRSYYEQVILPQVEDETTEAETDERCADVRDFERILGNGGTIVVKFLLHVSAEEQERRLVERMESLETAWKISANDWTARRNWDAYMTAFERTINETASPEAPWFVVPADHDWFHNVAVAEALVERLRPCAEGWRAERDRIGREKREEARQAAEEVGSGTR
jgi:PPK2 family polyphosphate:nucleotide phosphotransferase